MLHLCSALIRNPLRSYYFSGHELHLSVFRLTILHLQVFFIINYLGKKFSQQ